MTFDLKLLPSAFIALLIVPTVSFAQTSPPLWTGFYIGATMGSSFATLRGSGTAPVNSFSPKDESSIYRITNGRDQSVRPAFGLTLGFNRQSGIFVYGVEGDIGHAGLRSRRSTHSFGAGESNVQMLGQDRSQGDLLATLRLRTGLAAGRSLFFLTGGLAYSNTSVRRTIDLPAGALFDAAANISSCGPAAINLPFQRCWAGSTRLGLGVALGGGIEHRLYENWSIKFEHLYTYFGAGGMMRYLDPAIPAASISGRSALGVYTARIGLNYTPGGIAPAPSPEPTIDRWNSYYGGATTGFHWSRDGLVRLSATPNPGAVIPDLAPVAAAAVAGKAGRFGGFAGGLQFGATRLHGERLVLGTEADFQWLRGSESSNSQTSLPYGLLGNVLVNTKTVTNSTDWLAALRLRAGFLVTPRLQLYATGGLAMGGVTSVTRMRAELPGVLFGGLQTPQDALLNHSGVRLGVTAGAGVEWLMTRTLSAKLEYQYYDLGTANYRGIYNGWLTGQGGLTLLYSNPVHAKAHFNGHILRAGLNVRFE
jgi:outer membrane immunogenic protein